MATVLHDIRPAIRQALRNFAFVRLFNELGWDHLRATMTVETRGGSYTLEGVAQKKGFQVYHVLPGDDGAIPDQTTRRAIDREVTKRAQEHLLTFTDAANDIQVWQWTWPERGRPLRLHTQEYRRGASGEPLVQRLQKLFVSLDEDESLLLPDMVGRVRAAFDTERITKRFYDRFKTEHQQFRAFIQGIDEQGDGDWYASLMLNRLMFVYFVQKKGFLDGDPDYLRRKLAQVQERRGEGHFLSFYRQFLLRLFHEGLSQNVASRAPDLDALLGDVPYLNGGLFDIHQLERDHRAIDIPDEAFARLFAFFDAYRWHLDERPLRQDNEINPDVLGYIFEKYVNQKQMGAYYTKEDITDYIGKNTIVPALFDMARADCAVAFRPDGAIWGLLRDDPDRYIYPAVRQGVDLPLPPEIAAGLDDVAQRGGWNRPADPAYALPTETWREHVARRRRYEEVWTKLVAGDVTTIDDLITLNLDIRQFAQDVIADCEGPETLRAFWNAINRVTVLDPTCGSGAFLFAALTILQPLYEGCLDRMEAFVADLDRSGEPHSPRRFDDFKRTLAQVEAHPNRDYFILKRIILNNLYGVDIMEEAVEICKLRLFLKLAAQLDDPDKIEPLPDVDFNVRAGNTLVGFATYADVQRAITGEGSKQFRMDFGGEMARIDEAARKLDLATGQFRRMQTERAEDAAELHDAKAEVNRRLAALHSELDRALATEYKVNLDGPDADRRFAAWKASHQPFHWFVEFHEIVQERGGFDVIIGNPPYVEISKVRQQYSLLDSTTLESGNLYGPCIERSYSILKPNGRFGFIVQSPLVSTQRMGVVRSIIFERSDFLYYSTFDDRPSKLFDGMHHCRLAIVITRSVSGERHSKTILTTRYHKWYSEERIDLFNTIQPIVLNVSRGENAIPKLGSKIEANLFTKLECEPHRLGEIIDGRNVPIYYKITGVGHWFTFTTRPPRFWRDGQEGTSTRESTVGFSSHLLRDTAFCCLWSTLHYWYYQMCTNCRDFNPSDVRALPIPDSVQQGVPAFVKKTSDLMDRLEASSELSTATYKVGGAVTFERFRPRYAKPIIDEIDRVLAKHYGFTDEELDFIINYDIKYRMGRDADAETD